jgi:hypothetical protein
MYVDAYKMDYTPFVFFVHAPYPAWCPAGPLVGGAVFVLCFIFCISVGAYFGLLK